MDHFLEKDWEKDLRGLFKSSIEIDNEKLPEILDLPVDSLQGIDTVSKDKLMNVGIKTIYDLSQVVWEKLDLAMDKSIIKKWIRKAKIIINYVQNPLTRKKLLLVGLDYAGKTSLLSILKKDYTSIQDLLPTKGAQRDGVEFFGIPIITWDLGGQALYRKDYLDDKKYKLYFSETDVLFYVLDVQDQERYGESLAYYNDMLAAYKKLDEKPTVIILFHKLDPSLLEIETFMRNIAGLQVKIADISTNHEFSPIFANTSIYDKNSVFSAFSLGIRNISETAGLVTQLLEDYCIKTNGSAAVLLSSEGEVFAQTGVTKEYIELVTQNGLMLDTLLTYNVSKGFNPEKQPVLKFSDNEKYLIGLHVSSKMNKNIFVWLLVKNLIDFTSTVQFFKNEVEPLLNLFII